MAASIRRITRVPSAGEYPLRGESTLNEIRLEVMKPGPLAINASRVRRNNPAPTTSVKVKAICAVTITFRTRTLPNAVPPRSRSDDTTERLPTCQAGASPLNKPAVILATNAKSKRRESTAACKAVGAVSCPDDGAMDKAKAGDSAGPSLPQGTTAGAQAPRSYQAD